MKKASDFSMISLGCARTLVDTEGMIDRLQQVGFELKPRGSHESITILNTCSFIQAAIEETESHIQELSERKRKGLLNYLVVVGCYPSRFKKDLLKEKFPEVDLFLTTKEEHTLQTALSQLVFHQKFQTLKPYTKLTPSHFSYLKISEGCDNWCTFCTIPKIRGKHTSKPLALVIEEAKKQLSFGAQELILIAEDTTAWGEDLYGKPSLPILLKELSKLPVKWIRLMYIFPSRVDDDLIDTIANTPNITGYLDMPIQNVSTHLLQGMNRRHDDQFLHEILNKMRKKIPHFTFRTTLIVGFPSETDDDVNAVLKFLHEQPVDELGCFAYSEEKETRSFKYPNKVDPELIQKRLDLIMTTQYQLIQKRRQAEIGRHYDAVYEGNGLFRSIKQAPDVDSKLIVDPTPPLGIGQWARLQITGLNGYDLTARLL